MKREDSQGHIRSCDWLYAISLVLHTFLQRTETGAEIPQTLSPRAGDAIHPVLWMQGAGLRRSTIDQLLLCAVLLGFLWFSDKRRKEFCMHMIITIV